MLMFLLRPLLQHQPMWLLMLLLCRRLQIALALLLLPLWLWPGGSCVWATVLMCLPWKLLSMLLLLLLLPFVAHN